MKKIILISILYMLVASMNAQDIAPNIQVDSTIKKVKNKFQKVDDLVSKTNFVPLKDMRPIDISEGHSSKHSFDYGLSLSNNYYYDSSIANYLYLGYYRPYLRYMLNRKHIFSIRGKAIAKAYASDPDNGKKQSLEGALEILSAEMNFGNHKISIGRQFYNIANGVLFSNFADGISYETSLPFIDIEVNAMYSAQYDACQLTVQGCGDETNPYNVTPGLSADAQVKDIGKRAFFSFTATMNLFAGSQFRVNALYSYDMVTNQDATTYYNYDPLYLSGGMQGYIIIPQLRYLAEGIYQMGTTHSVPDTSTGVSGTDKVNIDAFAGIFNLQYSLPFLQEIIQPELVTSFAIASGDDDRASATTASQSNQLAKDNMFYTFGTYSGGLALKPELANIMIYRIGFTFKPLYFIYAFRNLGMGFKYSYYEKVNVNGVISDSTATQANKVIGNGLDAQLVYSLRSDVSIYYAFGYLWAGNAYPTALQSSDGLNYRVDRQVHLVSVSLNF